MDCNPLLFNKRHRTISFQFCFVLLDFQLVTELQETANLYLLPSADLGKGGALRPTSPLQGLDPLST